MSAVVLHASDEGTGAPIVFLHGLGDDHCVWKPIVALVSPRRRCVSVDLRGHGRTGAADGYALDGYADDVEAAIDRLQLEGLTLVGHSFGSVLACRVATRRPVRAVICVDQGLDVVAGAAILRPAAEMVRSGDHVALLASAVESMGWGSIDEESKRGIVERRAGLTREVMYGTWQPLLEGDPALLAEQNERLARITAPVIAVHGRDPGPSYSRWLATTIPTSRLEVWIGGGHYPHLSEPRRFAELVCAVSD